MDVVPGEEYPHHSPAPSGVQNVTGDAESQIMFD